MNNGYRMTADALHLFAIGFLLLHIFVKKCSTGVSGKMQILLAMVFTTRYLDLVTVYISPYNTSMKITFILCTYITLYLIYFQYRKTLETDHDSFHIEVLILPAFILSLLVNYRLQFEEVFWSFSIYLEAVAAVPQLYLIWSKKEAEMPVIFYVFVLGVYRFLYMMNWIYRYQTESHYDPISSISALLQVIIYCFTIGVSLFYTRTQEPVHTLKV